MPGGRPTRDPKGTLVAVRLAERQLEALRRRARVETTSLSEALRRIVDDWAHGYTSTRAPTPAERETFALLARAFAPRRRKR